MTEETAPAPAADLEKRYRAFLTRLSKHEAIKNAKDGLINEEHVRQVLVRLGERAPYLDEQWAKRVFGDKKLFEPAGDGFWKVLEEEGAPEGEERSAGQAPEWNGGVRPGEDVVGDTLRRAAGHIGKLPEPNWWSYRLEGEDWDEVSRVMILSFKHAQSRGLEKPFVPMVDRAMDDSLGGDDRVMKTIALWLADSMVRLDDLQKIQIAARDKVEDENLIVRYRPGFVRVVFQEDGTYKDVESEATIQVALRVVRGILIRRGFLPKKRD